MPVIINGSTGISGTDGSASVPAVQGTDTNTGMFFPAADTIAFAEGGVEALRLDSSGNATFTGTVQTAGITTNLYPLVPGTAVSVSGNSVNFTGIPSWARRITVMFNGVSTNGGSPFLVQLGAGSIATSGYQSNGQTLQSGSTINGLTSTAGFVSSNAILAGDFFSGAYVYNLLGSNFWTGGGTLIRYTSVYQTHLSVGGVTLSGTLDRVRITTVNGTDLFDAGSINIMYE